MVAACTRWCSIVSPRVADSKSRWAHPQCGFDPRLRHHVRKGLRDPAPLRLRPSPAELCSNCVRSRHEGVDVVAWPGYSRAKSKRPPEWTQMNDREIRRWGLRNREQGAERPMAASFAGCGWAQPSGGPRHAQECGRSERVDTLFV